MPRRPTRSRKLPLKLTAIQQQVLHLRLESALSFGEIARRLGRQKSTVYQSYLYAVEKSKLRASCLKGGDVVVPDGVEGEINEAELLERAGREEPGRRGLTPRERKFVDALLGSTNGDHRAAARMVGLDETTGNAIIQRPRVQEELARQMELVGRRTGIKLDRDRLLKELDYALAEIGASFSKEITAHGTCPNCERQVAVTIRAGPREVASLGVAIARATKTTAKIIGAMAPTKVAHTGKASELGTYHTLVRLVKENLHAVSFAQREEMIAIAKKDRADIDELLKLLSAEDVAH